MRLQHASDGSADQTLGDLPSSLHTSCNQSCPILPRLVCAGHGMATASLILLLAAIRGAPDPFENRKLSWTIRYMMLPSCASHAFREET